MKSTSQPEVSQSIRRRVFKDRGTASCAAREQWETVQLDRHALLSELALAMDNFPSVDASTMERAVQIIRTLAMYGGKADFLKLIDITKDVSDQQVLINTMDCAMAIGGTSAVVYLLDLIQRFSSLQDDTLHRVATYAYNRLLCDGYDMMTGPRANDYAIDTFERPSSAIGRSNLFAVSDEDATMAALMSFNPEGAKRVRKLLAMPTIE